MRLNQSIVTRVLACIALLSVLLVVPAPSQAAVRIDNDGQVPYYAHISFTEIYTDGEWVGIVFYRLPECVPADFNLLDFFDFAHAWACMATTDGFEVWETAPGVDQAPMHQILRGLGSVPVWFVRLDELDSAIGDGYLGMEELSFLPSLLVGSAEFFHGRYHPGGGAQKVSMVFQAHGHLQDGTPFRFNAEHTEANHHVVIDIG
ncbi:MAG: hypothetical protein R6X16_15945 [Anaerolineae bacterium]